MQDTHMVSLRETHLIYLFIFSVQSWSWISKALIIHALSLHTKNLAFIQPQMIARCP